MRMRNKKFSVKKQKNSLRNKNGKQKTLGDKEFGVKKQMTRRNENHRNKNLFQAQKYWQQRNKKFIKKQHFLY